MRRPERDQIMEFHEKLQQLRKQKGLTQEELAGALFVSRTAVSKWESGRGYPNIDSLKAVAKFFGITVDALLSGEELLNLAEADTRQKEMRGRDLLFGLLDCSAAMFFFLPLFGQSMAGVVEAVPLPVLTEIAVYLRIAFFAAVTVTVLWGVAILALQTCRFSLWVRYKHTGSLLLNGAGVLLFIVSMQPYAAALLFVFLGIKVLMLLKNPVTRTVSPL